MSELRHTDFMKGLKKVFPDYAPQAWSKYKFGNTKWYFQVYYGSERKIHYEIARVSAEQGRMLEIGLHLESRKKSFNKKLLTHFQRYIWEIRSELGEQIVAERWDRGWAKIYEAYPSEELTEETQAFAAQRLATIIETLQPLYQHIRSNM